MNELSIIKLNGGAYIDSREVAMMCLLTAFYKVSSLEK